MRTGVGSLVPGRLSLIVVPLALALLPVGCAARQSTAAVPPAVGVAASTPAPATAGPSVRAAWEETYLQQESVSRLTVTGVGDVEAMPDRTHISFAVETQGTTAQQAGETNAELMTRVSTALRTAGSAIPGFRIETSGYSLNPRYAPTNNERIGEIVGYTARNTIRVTVDQVQGIGGLIDGALAAGANRVSGIGFAVADPEPHRHEAMRLAVEAARAEAEVLASALGMRLGPPLDVQGGADYMPPPMPYDMMMSRMEAQAVPTPVEAGAQQITARVTIQYRLDVAP